jgi:hypothetical protein
MNCVNCGKEIIRSESYYLEEGEPSFGVPVGIKDKIVYIAPKYWIEKDGVRIVFCSPHCSTEWHKVQSAKS